MRKSLTMNGLRASAFALASLALSGTGAWADTLLTSTGTTTTTTVTTPVTTTSTTTATTPTTASGPSMEYYSTAGSTIGTTGVSSSDGTTGTGPVSFVATAGSFGLNSQVSFGQFSVAAMPDGATTTYNDTPFTIKYTPQSIGGDKFPPAFSPIIITGELNGTISPSTSNLVAKFDTVSGPVFSTPDGTYMSTISVANNPLSLVPSTAGGFTTIQGVVTTVATVQPPSGGAGGSNPGGTTQAPEPTTMAILATSLVGLGLRKKLGSARKPA